MTGATAVTATKVRYIKLGPSGRWAQRSIDKGEIHFGYQGVRHDLCVQRDWGAVRTFLSKERSGGALTSGVREVRDFYELGSDTLWITIHGQHLLWTFAEASVQWLGETETSGARMRKAIGGWKRDDIGGQPLTLNRLSSKLTQVAGYRGTICEVKDVDYLLRRIDGVIEPIVEEANNLRLQMTSLATRMIKQLHWKDFETLTDLIFARSGWQRQTTTGKDADIDMLIQMPSTSETGFVQVKSKTNQAELDAYYQKFLESGTDRFFFVSHSSGPLSLPKDKRCHLWVGNDLGDVVVRNGLFDWVVQRVG